MRLPSDVRKGTYRFALSSSAGTRS
jgi:hypothetical protein